MTKMTTGDAPRLVFRRWGCRTGAGRRATAAFLILWGAIACQVPYTQLSNGAVLCALREDTAIDCWACDDGNDLGQSRPTGGGYGQVSVGWGITGPPHACALTTAASATCWGDNSAGQLDAPPGELDQVSAGSLFTCGIRRDRTLACWGSNDQGETDPPAGQFVRVSAGIGYACAIGTDASLACWGRGGIGSEPPSMTVEPPPSEGAFSEVAAQLSGGCALETGGAIDCWGTYASAFPSLENDTDYVQLGGVGCALHSDGQPDCYNRGQSDEYVAGPPPGRFLEVSGGCGILDDGHLTCWGHSVTCSLP